MKTFKVEAVCKSCDGTGLYQGMAERDGAAVICTRCDGTGCATIEIDYEVFKERKMTDKVKRVYKDGSGYCISSEDVTTEDGELFEFSKEGVSYEEWLQGKQPGPIKILQCPYQWERQQLQHSEHKAHELYEAHCRKGLNSLMISKCSYRKEFGTTGCWALYEKLTCGGVDDAE